MPTFKEQEEIKLKAKAKKFMDENLPDFCKTYFRGRRSLSGNSIVSYCYELEYFFRYLTEKNLYFRGKRIKEIELDDIDKLNVLDIEEFLDWLHYHKDDDLDRSSIPSKKKNYQREFSNKDTAIEKYVSCLSAFWKYFYERGMLSSNPVSLVERIKRKPKEIVYLTEKEQDKLIDSVMYGTGLTDRQQKFHQKTEVRDLALMVLFLHTGMRISEIYGINVQDINFDKHCVGIYRKGNKYEEVYFSDECETHLKEYLNIRDSFKPLENEDAFFLSGQGKRLCVRQIQKMVKKYAMAAVPEKSNVITPHKLRSTYATAILEKTGGDIRAVQELMGHQNIATTTIYAAVIGTKESKRNLMQKK